MIRTYALIGSAAALAVALFLVLVPHWALPPIQSTSYGPPEGEMVVFKKAGQPVLSPPQPEIAPISFSTTGPSATSAYQNVQVLTDVSKAEFDRTMVAITQWVAPQQGCGFCHGGQVQNFAADYPKKQIARQMLAMTRVMNANWTNHVGVQGVTCFSCHAGKNIPAEHWYLDPPLTPPEGENSLLGKPQAWNTKAKTIREFFPRRPFRMFFLQGLPANLVQAKQALRTTDKANYQHDREYTEQVYIVMMQMSNGLGVNCTYCHNSRSLYDYSQSPPNRLYGYSGIKMTTMLNQNYLSRIAQWTDPKWLGQMGDSPKVDCKTCHQGEEKPIGGMQHVVYPALIGPVPNGVANPVAAENPTIPQLAKHPRVGVPGSDLVGEYHGSPQG